MDPADHQNKVSPSDDNLQRTVVVRCPAVTHRRLMDTARHRKTSMNAICNELLNQPLRDSLAGRGSAWQLAERLKALMNLAVTCRRRNTDAWMQLLENEINRAAVAIGDTDRARYVHDGFAIDRGEEPLHA